MRRDDIRASAAGGLQLRQRTPTLRFVHLTDPHLTSLDGVSFSDVRGKRRLGYLSWNRRRSHHHRPETLARLVEHMRSLNPEAVLLTGDLTQLGLASEFEQARAWLADLASCPVLLVPGNHDFYRADAVPWMFEHWSAALPGETHSIDDFPYRWSRAGVAVIGLCSADPDIPFWSAGGRLGAPQRERLRTMLQQTRDQLRFVLVHHPPVRGLCARRKALLDDVALTRLLESEGVDIVLYGHVHRNAACVLNGGTRVFSTASASNGAADARAALRVFDIEGTGDRRRIRMSLHALACSGEIKIVDEQAWTTRINSTCGYR